MTNIQVYYKAKTPVERTIQPIVLQDRDFTKEFVTPADIPHLEENWKNVCAKQVSFGKTPPFSTPRMLGALHDNADGVYKYIPTEFKTYVGASLTKDAGVLSPQIYDQMRVASVSGVVQFADDRVLVHRRSQYVTHCAGLLDSSVGGFIFINNGAFDVEASLNKKLANEIKLKPEEILSKKHTGIHSSDNPDHSGMFDFVIRASIPSTEIQARTDPTYMSECNFPRIKELPDFLVENYGNKQNNMIGDGAAALLASLEHETYKETVERIQKAGKSIKFGKLVTGVFVEGTLESIL